MSFVQVALGLQAMHSLQPPLAHRDVKPHNVLLEARCTAGVDEADALSAQPLQARPARLSFSCMLSQTWCSIQAKCMCALGHLFRFCEGISLLLDLLCPEQAQCWTMGTVSLWNAVPQRLCCLRMQCM